MFVDFARVSDGVIRFEGADYGRVAFGNVEGGAVHDDVGGVGAAGPFLTVGAVAEGGYCGLA